MSPSHTTLVLLGLAAAAAVVSAAARRRTVPYPVALVALGLALSFVPGLPAIRLDSDVVLMGFLPVLVYDAAFSSSAREMREHAAVIGTLATGLVVVTAVAVAGVAWWLVGLGWTSALVLGAALGPTDPIAAIALMERFPIRSGLRSVLEGEALINDGIALVLFELAVDLARGGGHGPLDVAASLAQAIVVGVGVGLAVGWATARIRSWLHDPPIEVVVSILAAYGSYLCASALRGSGVLAALGTGLVMAGSADHRFAPESRLVATSFWNVLGVILNTALFALVGLELRELLPQAGGSLPSLAAWSALLATVVLVARHAWMSVVPRLLDRAPKLAAEVPKRGERAVLTTAGMRGAVSLAAALAVPITTRSGGPFPDRRAVVALTFGVVIITLLVQGTAIAPVVRRVGPGSGEGEDPVLAARRAAAERALVLLDEIEADRGAAGELDAVRARYRARLEMIQRAAADEDRTWRVEARRDLELRRELLAAERAVLHERHADGRLSSPDHRRLVRALDLESARLSERPAARADLRDV